MDVLINQLGHLLLNAVPTLLIVIFLHFYLKSVFFKPLERVLQKRYEATEGARKLAAESLERAAAKAAEYENKIRDARTAIYRSNEQFHKEMAEKQAAQTAQARQRAEAAVNAAKAQIAAEVEQAKASLPVESEKLANEIVESVLGQKAA
jgi:F-type H+-transporting ATPase subunit b